MFKNRWYGRMHLDESKDYPMGVAQIEHQLHYKDHPAEGRRTRINLPEPILRLAQEEYDIQHPGQPYERMQQRGGLGIFEIIGLMADHIERLKYQKSKRK